MIEAVTYPKNHGSLNDTAHWYADLLNASPNIVLNRDVPLNQSEDTTQRAKILNNPLRHLVSVATSGHNSQMLRPETRQMNRQSSAKPFQASDKKIRDIITEPKLLSAGAHRDLDWLTSARNDNLPEVVCRTHVPHCAGDIVPRKDGDGGDWHDMTCLQKGKELLKQSINHCVGDNIVRHVEASI
jgi:hypothetical protein